MDGEHDGGVKERFKWGPHFHYFGDYTLGIVMLRTRGFFFSPIIWAAWNKNQLKRQL